MKGSLKRKREPVQNDEDNGTPGAALSHFALDTTMHGVKYLSFSGSNGKQFRRVFWLLLLIVSFTIFVVQMRKKIESYLENPILTSVKMEYPSSMSVPAIAICNENQLRISFVSSGNLYRIVGQIYDSVVFPLLQEELRRDYQLIKENPKNFSNGTFRMLHLEDVESLISLDKLYQENSTAYMIDATHQPEQMLVGCHYPGYRNCSIYKFKQILTDVGVCYTLNSNTETPVKVTGGGLMNALILFLNLETYESMAGPALFSGFKILAYKQGTIPILSSKAVDASAGFGNIISLNYVETRKLSVDQKGTCVKPKANSYYTEKQYNLETCIEDAFYASVVDYCGCSPYNAPVNAGTVKVCSLLDHFLCFVPNEQWLRRTSLHDHCKENCTSISYTASTSMSQIPNSLTKQIKPMMKLKNNVSFEIAMEAKARYNLEERELTMRIIDNFEAAVKLTKQFYMAPLMKFYNTTFVRLNSQWEAYKNVTSSHGAFIDGFLDFEAQPDGINRALKDEAFIRRVLSKEQADKVLQAANFTEATAVLDAFSAVLPWFRARDKFKAVINRDYYMFVQTLFLIEQYRNFQISKHEWALEQEVSMRLPVSFRNELNDPATQDLANFLHALQTDNKGFKILKKAVSENSDDFWYYTNLILTAMRPPYFIGRDCSDFEKILKQYNEHGRASDITLECQISVTIDAKSVAKDVFNCAEPDEYQYVKGKILHPLHKSGSALECSLIDINQHMEEYKTLWQWRTEFFKDNLVGIVVQFGDLSKQIVSQRLSYDIWSLFSDIGGTMGLFLGASIMTVCEIVDFCLYQAVKICQPKEKTKEEKVKKIEKDFALKTETKSPSVLFLPEYRTKTNVVY